MTSKVEYASCWNATNGLSESMLEALPSRNNPPCFALPPLLLPPQAVTAIAAVTTAATARRVPRLAARGLVVCWLRRSLTRIHLRLSCRQPPVASGYNGQALPRSVPSCPECRFKLRNPDIAAQWPASPGRSVPAGPGACRGRDRVQGRQLRAVPVVADGRG